MSPLLTRVRHRHRSLAESSYIIYGSGDLDEKPLTEDRHVPVRPPATTAGGGRRAANEGRARAGAAQAATIEGIVLRFGSLYGPGPGLEAMVRELEQGHMPVQHQPQGRVPWVHFDEAADAVAAAVEIGNPGAAYNVAADGAMSVAEFVRCLASATGTPRPPSVAGWVLESVAPYLKPSLINTRLLLPNSPAAVDPHVHGTTDTTVSAVFFEDGASLLGG